MNSEFGVFSDESSHTDSRFRSIAAVSLPVDYIVKAQEDLFQLLSSSNVTEFKWNKLKGAKYKFCAKKIIDYLIEHIFRKQIRVDILIWDVYDDRHDIIGRDDIKNFERMFFHLHKNLMQRRETEAEWYLCPDERTDINWKDIRSCLDSVGAWKKYFNHPLLKDIFSERFYSIKALKEVDSEKRPFCQVADLFAGMGAYTRKRRKVIKRLIASNQGQRALFKDKNSSTNISNIDNVRFEVINYLYGKSRNHKLGLSLETEGYFHTHDPQKPINFWHYAPQHEKDIAPTR